MTTPLLAGFPPVVDERASVLILGSFPSVLSLAAGQYYANPRNAFWPITGQIFGFDCTATYFQRLAELQSHGVALWDVLRSCRRVGSADAAIDPKSLVANGFAELFADYPAITRVYFNGAKAARLFTRLVPASPAIASAAQPGAAGRRQLPALEYQRLPSTSPAHAIARDQKLAAWKVIRQPSSDL